MMMSISLDVFIFSRLRRLFPRLDKKHASQHFRTVLVLQAKGPSLLCVFPDFLPG